MGRPFGLRPAGSWKGQVFGGQGGGGTEREVWGCNRR